MQLMAEMVTTLKDIDYVLKLQEVAVILVVVVVATAVAVAVAVEDQLDGPIIASLFQGYQKLEVGRI